MSKTKYICIVFILICVIGIFAVFSNSANKRSEQKKSSIDKDIRSSNTPDYEFYLSNNPIDKLNDNYDFVNMDKRSYLENENINIVKGTSLINGSMLIDDNIYSKYKSSELYNYSYDFQNDLNKIGNDISYVDSCSIPTNTYLKASNYLSANEIIMMLD